MTKKDAAKYVLQYFVGKNKKNEKQMKKLLLARHKKEK